MLERPPVLERQALGFWGLAPGGPFLTHPIPGAVRLDSGSRLLFLVESTP